MKTIRFIFAVIPLVLPIFLTAYSAKDGETGPQGPQGEQAKTIRNKFWSLPLKYTSMGYS